MFDKFLIEFPNGYFIKRYKQPSYFPTTFKGNKYDRKR